MTTIFGPITRDETQQMTTRFDADRAMVHRLGAALPPEFLRLFYAAQSIDASEQACVLQFMACTPGSGTSTVVAGLGQAVAAERDDAILIVDCAIRAVTQTPTLVAAFRQSGSIDQAILRQSAARSCHVASLAGPANLLLDVSAQELRQVFELLRSRYKIVALDCASATTPEAAALSRLCNGTVIVIEAEATPHAAVERLREEIARLGGRVVGVVLNRRRRALPRWLERFL